jgi:hypothetical protein
MELVYYLITGAARFSKPNRSPLLTCPTISAWSQRFTPLFENGSGVVHCTQLEDLRQLVCEIEHGGRALARPFDSESLTDDQPSAEIPHTNCLRLCA